MPASAQSPSGYKLCPQCRQIYASSVELCPRDQVRLIIDKRIIAGKYILLNRIGVGRTSEVYAAEQPQLGRMVAIKLLQRDPDVELHFDSQVRSIGTVKHDHVVTLYDSGRIEDGRPYLAMEYLDGVDLNQHLLRSGAMSGERAVLLWRQAVSAIAAAHRRHIVHGDINPTNLFLTHKDTEEGQQEIVKVIDFHIGKRTVQPEVADPNLPGNSTGRYLAPEQRETCEATPRADVYALGLVLLEMLSGRVVWDRTFDGKEEGIQNLLRQLVQPRAQGSGQPPLSEGLVRLVGEVLHRSPEDRPADAGELVQLIKALPESGVSAQLAVSPEGFEVPEEVPAPEWLAYTQEQPTVKRDPGAANSPKPIPVATSEPDPFDGSETPQMGVAALTDLLKQLQEERATPPAVELPTPQVSPAPSPVRGSRIALRLVLVILVFGALGGALSWFTRTQLLAPPVATASAPTDLTVASSDFGVASSADLSESGEPEDLGKSRDGESHALVDLWAAVDAGSAQDGGDAGAIRVKFVYDPESVTSIECNQDSLVAPRAGDKHSPGIEAILRPGGIVPGDWP